MKKAIFCLLLSILCFGSFFIYQKKNPPLVSVIMPIHNRANLASRSIESILNQTMKDFEFIIVDDGSNEETKQVLKKYAKKDSRIRLIHNPKNRGIAYSRQRGLDAARGTYVAIMDSDDWSTPDRLDKQLAFMQDNPDVTALTASIKSFPNGKFIPDYTIKNSKEYHTKFLPGFYEVELLFYNNFPNASSFFKRDFVEKKHIKYDTSLISAEDYDFWRQFVFNGANLASISDTVLYVGSDSLKPKNYYSAMDENSVNIHKKMFEVFFKPTKNELKFDYSTNEKCQILKKIKSANLKNSYLPQIYLENRYNSRCPNDLKNSYYLVHKLNNWSGYIEKTDGDKWVRIETKNTGKLVKVDENTIEVYWDGYPKERFVKNKNNEWDFEIEGEKITLKHINWSDEFIISASNLGCRVNAKTECARIKKNTDNTIWIDWKNNAWANEEFKKNRNGIYEFVRELNNEIKF